MVDRNMITMHTLSEYLSEYKELNVNNTFRPVAVGRFGIRTRESIYSKELAKDYSKNKLIHKGTLTVGMGSTQMDIGILSEDVTYSVSPAYHTYKISGINCDYLRYCLQCRNMDMFKRYMKRGSRQGKSIDLERWVDYEIPIYSDKIQNEIVENLTKVQKIIRARKKEIEVFDTLIKARFVEMFGDPIANEKRWNTKPLLSIGSCKNGMNFHYDESGVEIHCLGVGDFKDYSVISDTSLLSTISLNEMPSQEYLLQDGDIVFVRSNGNKKMVGRSVAVYPGMVPTTFSGFCIRYRRNTNEVITSYLLRVLKSDSMRQQMYGRGANIQNLNQQTLSSLNIPVPPKVMQKEFATFSAQIDKSKVAVQKALNETQILFDNLMQEYFG